MSWRRVLLKVVLEFFRVDVVLIGKIIFVINVLLFFVVTAKKKFGQEGKKEEEKGEKRKKVKNVVIYSITRELPGVALVNCAISHIFTII